MAVPSDDAGKRMGRAIGQRLASLRAAGVTHVRRAKPGPAPKAAPAKPRSAKSQVDSGAGATAGLSSSAGQARVDKPPVAPSTCTNNRKLGEEPRVAALAEVACRVAACKRCAELVDNRTQTVFGVGNPHTRLVFLGEAPGADEDRQGEPFVGRAGQLLTDIITKGMKLRREDVYIMNILRCRPPDNRTPLPAEAAACREYLDAQLAIIQPEFICCLGACAAQNLLDTTEAIGRLRGRLLDFQGMKVLCTYHPAYVLRNPPAKRQVWDDIQVLMAAMGLKV